MNSLRIINEHKDLEGKKVLLRVDLNLPIQEGKVSEQTRVQRIIPTILFLSSQKAKVILLSHFGRPNGAYSPSLSLKPIVSILENLLEKKVHFVEDCIGEKAKNAIAALSCGDILLLENTRFHMGEEKNDPDFTKKLAENGDIFVNDAFSAAHRAHASTEGLAHFMPSFAGLAMQEELNALDKVLGHPLHPVAAIVGGAKISTKIDLLTNLISKVDTLIIGGGMANTFLAAQGIKIGKSLCEYDLFEVAKKTTMQAKEIGCTILLPIDACVAKEFKAGTQHAFVSINAIESDTMILDVGSKTVSAICESLDSCSTLIWNGPLGAFEISPFEQGTISVAHHVSKKTREGKLISVAGGGDTLSALKSSGTLTDFSYVSSAGGAFLEWMEGKPLPGVEILKGKDQALLK